MATDRRTKLILNLALGRGSQATTNIFIEGLRAATADQRFQTTTDGFQLYISAIDATRLDRVDYGRLIKVYAQPTDGERRYSLAEVVEACNQNRSSVTPIRTKSALHRLSARI